MIQYIQHQDLDTAKWDACINGDPSALVYPLHWYLDLTCKEWDALVVGDYEAVFPLPKNTKWGVQYLFRPYGTQQLGLFGKSATAELLQEMLQFIPRRFLWVDFYLNERFVPPLINGFVFQEQTNQVLDISGSYQSIYEGYNQRTRRNIKKAKQQKFQLFEYDSPEVILQLFQSNKGAALEGWTDWHYSRMRQMMYVLIHKRRGFLWTLHDETNTPCAGVFLVQYRHRLVSLFTAVSEFGKAHGAMSHLLDELFIFYSNKGFLYDFEGSNLPGLAEFNAGFGAKRSPYFRAVRSHIPFLKSLRL